MTPLRAPTAPAGGTDLTPIREDIAALGRDVAALAAAVARPAESTVARDVRAAAVGVFQAVAALLAVRMLLLLSLLGGFALAVMALRTGTMQAAGVLVAYAVLIVIPFVALERFKGAPPHA